MASDESRLQGQEGRPSAPPLSEFQQAAILRLQKDESIIPAPIWLARQAHLPNDAIERAHAERDPDGFWAERARLVEWMEPFQEVSRFDPPRHQWFVGGKLNVTVNCIDRHVYSERRNKAALIWVGEDGEEHAYTYGRLYREVNRLANTLKRLGLGRGDRAIIYMPLTPEGVISMLACARIGAIHSVVYAGMGTQALRARIEDCRARIVICSDFTFRRGRKVPLKPTVDEAVRDLIFVEHIIVHRRGSRPGDEPYSFESDREHDFYDIQEAREIHCPPESMDAEDPLFILYTSGTTGTPKGVVHTTGGYLVGVTYLARAFYQITDRDIFWSTSDIGWIVGHSFIVYGPLSCGATVFCREGVPDYPSPEVTWELCERFGVNLMFTAPTAVRMWMSHGNQAPAKYDLSRLRLIACAGEPLNPEAHAWAQQNLAGQGDGMVVDNWWQTEIAAPVLGTLPTFDARPGKVGKAMPGVDADVVDAQGRPVPDGHGGLPDPAQAPALHDAHHLERPCPLRALLAAGARRRLHRRRHRRARPGRLLRRAGAVRRRHERGRAPHRHRRRGRGPGAPSGGGRGGGHRPPRSHQGRTHQGVRGAAGRDRPGPGLIASLKDHVRQDLGPIATPADIEIRTALPKTRSGKIVRRYLKAVEMGEDPGDLSTLAD